MSDQPPPAGEGAPGASGPPRYPSTPPDQPPPDQPTPYPPPGSWQPPPPPPGAWQPPGPAQPPAYAPPYGGGPTGGYGPPGGQMPPPYPAGGGWQSARPATELAAYSARLGGWLIDFVILFVAYALIEAVFRSVRFGRITFNTTNSAGVHQRAHLSVVAWLIQIAVVLLYGALLCGSERGQTLGMMAVSVRAVDGRTGGPIGFWRGLGRAAFEWLLWVVFFIPWVIDMLFPIWDVKNQTLHDKVSGTVVVKASATPPG